MAIPPDEQKALGALRANIEALKGDLSYRQLAKQGGFPESLGRTLNFFVKGDSYPGADTLADAAEALDVDLFQLFLPGVAELDKTSRQQLSDIVRAFVSDGDSMRQALNGTLRAIREAVEKNSQQGDARQEPPRRRRG